MEDLPRDLLHNSQGPVLHASAKGHLVQVQHHVLAVVGAWDAEKEKAGLFNTTLILHTIAEYTLLRNRPP